MQNIHLNIGADAVLKHTVRLERIHRSALPVAVRQSLNRAAFDVKTNTMPKEAKRFIQRSPTFFRATSKVAPAQGFDIRTMVATVGFMPQSGIKESGSATENLEQQENAGQIEHRAFIPLAAARAGGSWRRRVVAKRTLAYINSRQSVGAQRSIVDALHSTSKNKKVRFIRAALAAGKGGFVLGTEKRNGARKLLAINSIKRVGRNLEINSTAIYNVKAKRKVNVKSTKFMRKASLYSAKSIEKYYGEEAKKQIAKLK